MKLLWPSLEISVINFFITRNNFFSKIFCSYPLLHYVCFLWPKQPKGNVSFWLTLKILICETLKLRSFIDFFCCVVVSNIYTSIRITWYIYASLGTLTSGSPGEDGGCRVVVQFPICGYRVLEFRGSIPVAVQPVPWLKVHHCVFYWCHSSITAFWKEFKYKIDDL